MKRGLILTNAYWNPAELKSQCRRLKDECAALGMEAEVRSNDIFPAALEGGNITAGGGYDFCIYLDKDKYVSQMLEKTGLRLFNCHAATEACDDKMTTHVRLAGEGIAMPKTLPGLLCYSADEKIKSATISRIEKKLGYPVVVKKCYGSGGRFVYKADDREQLISLAEQVKCEPHLFQEFISSSCGRDVRVIVVGGRAAGGMLRKSDADFRSNIALGGSGENFILPDSFKAAAEKAAGLLKLDYCGIDFLFGDCGEPVLCEVNSNAFFGGFEKATGINVARLYAQHIFNVIGKL